MSSAIVRKELREHAAVLSIAFALSLLVLAGMQRAVQQEGGRFVALTQYAMTIGLLQVLILSSRLFVREYAGRTQLFLEVLPISRTRVFTTKWLLGAFVLLFNTALAWSIAFFWARQTEVLTASQSLPTLFSVSLFMLCLWSFAVMAGVLGRYRYAVWVVGAVIVSIVANVGGIPLMEIAVFRLLGEDVAMATGVPAVSEQWVAAGFAIACVSGSAALTLIGSGAMASALSRRMTARERVVLIVSLLGAVTLAETLTPKPAPPPYELTTTAQFERDRVQVSVLETADVDAAAAQELAAQIADDVESLAAALNIDTSTAVFITPQRGLDPFAIQRAALNETGGIVIKAAPDAPREELRALVLHSLLSDYTLLRGYRDDRHVLLDGLAAYWAMRNDPAAQASWWLRAAAVPEAVNATTLTKWSLTSERWGECLSQALAYAAFDVLQRQIGAEKTQTLMRQLLQRPHTDVRVLFEASPTSELNKVGVNWSTLAQQLERERIVLRAKHALDTRTPLTASISVVDDPAQGLTLESAVTGVDRYRVYHQELLPWTADVGNMTRFDVIGQSATLPLSLTRRARILAAIEVDDPMLKCPVRVFAERITLP